MTPVRWAGWEDGEGPILRAKPKDFRRAGGAVLFGAAALVGYSALSRRFGGSPISAGFAPQIALAVFGGVAQAWNAARGRAAGPDGLLDDAGEPATVRILHRGVCLGADAGMMTLENGLLCFHGRRTTFAVPPSAITVKDSRLHYVGPGGWYEAQVTIPGTTSLLSRARWASPAPEAVEVLPPVTVGPGVGGERLVCAGLAFIGLLFVHLGLSPECPTPEMALGMGVAILLPTLLFAAHVWRVRRSRR